MTDHGYRGTKMSQQAADELMDHFLHLEKWDAIEIKRDAQGNIVWSEDGESINVKPLPNFKHPERFGHDQ